MKDSSELDKPSSIEVGLDSERIRALGYKIVDMITEELSHPDKRPPRPAYQSPDIVEHIFEPDLPEDGTDPEALLEVIQQSFLPLSPNHSHSGLFSHISSAALPFPALAEALISSMRLYTYNWSMSPASTQVEMNVIRWLGQFIGYDDHAAGYIATGGTSANLMGLLAARAAQTNGQVNAQGLYDNKVLTAYVSEAAHSCIDQAMRIMGIGNNQLRRIPADQDFKVKTDALEQAIIDDLEKGYQPFCVIGVAGTTDFGSIDDLSTLATIAKKYDLWFHVDGAYGAFAASLPSKNALFKGIEEADSLVCDPHKWLNIPFEAGAVLVKNWDHLKAAFAIKVTCMDSINVQSTHSNWNHWEHGFELTRSDRALKIWLALKQYGAKSYRQMIGNHIGLSEYMAAKIQASDELELVTHPVLSVCCFRYINKDHDLDAEQLSLLTEEIEKTMHDDGISVIGSTKIAGWSVLRACIVSHRITQDSVDTLLDTVIKAGRKNSQLLFKGKEHHGLEKNH